MNGIEQLSADYEALRGMGWQPLPQLHRAYVVVAEPKIWNDPRQVEEEIAALERGAIGWIRRQTGVAVRPSGADPLDPAVAGLPLAGEWTWAPPAPGESHPRRSAQLRFAGGAWRLTELTEHERPVEGARELLRENVSFLAENAFGYAWLHYVVYWGAEGADPGAVGPLFARFAGFESNRERIP